MIILPMLSSGPIKYRRLKSGGYELLGEAWLQSNIASVPGRINDRYGKPILILTQSGKLIISPGYKWDGASGPVIDRKANMRAGLFHDGFYQLMRAGKLDYLFRDEADRIYRQLYLDDGGWHWIGWLDYTGLRGFAGYAARRQIEIEVETLVAP